MKAEVFFSLGVVISLLAVWGFFARPVLFEAARLVWTITFLLGLMIAFSAGKR